MTVLPSKRCGFLACLQIVVRLCTLPMWFPWPTNRSIRGCKPPANATAVLFITQSAILLGTGKVSTGRGRISTSVVKVCLPHEILCIVRFLPSPGAPRHPFCPKCPSTTFSQVLFRVSFCSSLARHAISACLCVRVCVCERERLIHVISLPA